METAQREGESPLQYINRIRTELGLVPPEISEENRRAAQKNKEINEKLYGPGNALNYLFEDDE